jgi:di/tricarboxylate transporter
MRSAVLSYNIFVPLVDMKAIRERYQNVNWNVKQNLNALEQIAQVLKDIGGSNLQMTLLAPSQQHLPAFLIASFVWIGSNDF